MKKGKGQVVSLLIKAYDGHIQEYKKFNWKNISKYERITKQGRRLVWRKISKYPYPTRTFKAHSRKWGRATRRFHFDFDPRFPLEDSTLHELLDECRHMFIGTKRQVKRMNEMRIGVAIAREPPIIDEIYIQTADKKKGLEVGDFLNIERLDWISTTTYERDPLGVDPMFEELAAKLMRYALNNMESPTLFEKEETGAVVKEFVVYFTRRLLK